MALACTSIEYVHAHWGPGMSALEPFAEALLARISDGTIGTVEGMKWFRPAIAKAMKKTSATRYTSAHCYRSLLDVLGMSVPGDPFFLMGTGADLKALSIFTSRRNLGIVGLSSFNKCVLVTGMHGALAYHTCVIVVHRWMADRIGVSYVPFPDVGRLSYYLCMIGNSKYMAARQKVMEQNVSLLGRYLAR